MDYENSSDLSISADSEKFLPEFFFYNYYISYEKLSYSDIIFDNWRF